MLLRLQGASLLFLFPFSSFILCIFRIIYKLQVEKSKREDFYLNTFTWEQFNFSFIEWALLVFVITFKWVLKSSSSLGKASCQDYWQWTSFIFIFSLLFYFFFSFLFYFLFLEQLRLGVISHAVTSVTNWWHSHKTDHGTWENGVEGTRIKWRHTAWTTHDGLM